MRIIIFLGCFISISAGAAVTAKVADVDGGSFILAGPAKGVKEKIRKGESVAEGDVVHVPKGTSARLVFKNGIQVALNAGSRFKVTKHAAKKRDVPLLDKLFGTVRVFFDGALNDKQEKFIIQTRSVVAGVRGTDFVVEDNGKQTDIHTLEGRVAVAKSRSDFLAGKIKALGAGQMIRQLQGRQLAKVAKFDRKKFINRIQKKFPNMQKLRERGRQMKRDAQQKVEKEKAQKKQEARQKVQQKIQRVQNKKQSMKDRLKERAKQLKPPKLPTPPGS